MSRSGIWVRSNTEGPSTLKQDPSVGVTRILCNSVLAEYRDTRAAPFRLHRDGLAGCPEDNNTVYSSNKRDSCAVTGQRRHRFYKYGFRQISDLSGNARHVPFASVLIRVLFSKKVPLLRMLEQDKGTKALFIYPTKVSFDTHDFVTGLNSSSRL